MRHRILIVLLALGTVGGYASGIASLRHRSQCRRAWMEAHTAHTCPPCSATASADTPAHSSPR